MDKELEFNTLFYFLHGFIYKNCWCIILCWLLSKYFFIFLKCSFVILTYIAGFYLTVVTLNYLTLCLWFLPNYRYFSSNIFRFQSHSRFWLKSYRCEGYCLWYILQNHIDKILFFHSFSLTNKKIYANFTDLSFFTLILSNHFI